MEYRLSVKRGDFVVSGLVLVIAIVLGLSIGFILSKQGSGTAVITQNGAVVDTINLDALAEPVTIEINGDYHNVIVAEKGRIRMESSDCPGESCVHSGWISDSGKTIVCLPNRVEIKITGTDSEIDAVVR